MTQEEKQLLLKDLCARLPYKVKVKYIFDDSSHCPFELSIKILQECLDKGFLPYLRSMSSMTDEEKMQLKEEQLKDTRLFAEALTKAAAGDTSMRGKVIPHFAADWCNKNHFDYRGFIPMGLAIEAPEDMYKED